MILGSHFGYWNTIVLFAPKWFCAWATVYTHKSMSIWRLEVTSGACNLTIFVRQALSPCRLVTMVGCLNSKSQGYLGLQAFCPLQVLSLVKHTLYQLIHPAPLSLYSLLQSPYYFSLLLFYIGLSHLYGHWSNLVIEEYCLAHFMTVLWSLGF